MKSFKVFPLVPLFLVCLQGCKENQFKTEKSSSETANIDYNRKTQSLRTEIYPPEKELAGFKLPDGFIIELVASEENGIVNPIDLTFDDAGRLWTQTARMYPLDPVADIQWQDLLKLMDDPEAQKKNPNFKRNFDLYQGKTKGSDKILILSNLHDRSNIKVETWADGLAIPMSILPYKNGAYVAQGSELFFLEDTDFDDKADKRTRLLTGFGITDTHTMAHLLVRGPGDWIHFSHGALNKGEVTSLVNDTRIRLDYSKIVRFSLDAKKLELVNAGLNNIWGFQLRGNGQWYGVEANDKGYSAVPMEPGTSFPGIGMEKLRPYQPFMPELHAFRVGGTGLSGLAFSDDVSGSFPEAWRNVALLANPVTSAINAVRIIRNADGSVTAEHLPDFLTSADDWFRPVNLEFGPDGCLYIADWYNKIISHNELPTTHPDRDKSHGRIWRIRHKPQKIGEIPNLYEAPTRDLLEYLKSPSIWAKRAAWHQISDRPKEETSVLAKDLMAIAKNKSQDEQTSIIALWSLEGMRHYDEEVIEYLLSSQKSNLRREAVRSLSSFSLEASKIAKFLEPALTDNAMVRSQVLRTLEEVGVANSATIGLLVSACKPELEGDSLGGAYERKFERYLARKALESYPEELQKFLSSPQSNRYDGQALIWTSQALPSKEDREKFFLKLWKKEPASSLDESTFVIISKMLTNPKVYKATKSIIASVELAEKNITYALRNQNQVQSPELKKLLTAPAVNLIRSDNEALKQLGLEAAAKLQLAGVRETIISLIETGMPESDLKLAMQALGAEPAKNTKVFLELARNAGLSQESRATAIHNLAKADITKAYEIIVSWLPKLNENQRIDLTKLLSGSPQSAKLLKLLFDKKLLTPEDFDLSSAERIQESNVTDPKGKAILDAVKERLETEKRAFEERLHRFLAIAEKKDGNPAQGEQLFQSCLMCHRVGDKGQNIAPALDGSGLRDDEALLTSLLAPDAAVESSYAVYRVTKKDRTIVEGYLANRNNRGTTIAFMGGSEVFIPIEEIEKGEYLGGRSFMPNGLLDYYSDDQVANLLAYIKTLK